MKEVTTAQQLMLAMGVDFGVVMLGGHRQKMPSHTKKGPGRYHKQGKAKSI